MIDRLFASPAVLVASIIVLAMLVGSFLVNREKAELQRRKGPKRFRPDWSRTRAGDYRKKPGYQRKTGAGFKPQWKERPRGTGGPLGGLDEPAGETGEPPRDRDEPPGRT